MFVLLLLGVFLFFFAFRSNSNVVVTVVNPIAPNVFLPLAGISRRLHDSAVCSGELAGFGLRCAHL